MELQEQKKPLSARKGLLIVLAVVFLAMSGWMGWKAAAGSGGADGAEPGVFDPTGAYSEDDPEQVGAYFNLLSEPFASFTIGEDHGFYIAMDSDEDGWLAYILCLSDTQFDQFYDIYDFTFSDTDWSDGPGYAQAVGYPVSMKTDTQLRSFAMEYFNDVLMGEELVTAANFSEYFGTYYLDCTYQPKSGTSDVLLAVLFLAMALLMLFLAFRRKKEQPAPGELAADGSVTPYSATSAEAGEAGELPRPINHGLGILGAVVGALLGGVIWVVVYRADFIAGIVGYLIILFAVQGYKKLGGGINRGGAVLCTLLSLAMIFLATGVGYAWSIADAVNKYNPGRASLAYVLGNFGNLMETLDMWGYFAKDVAIGIVLAVAGSMSLLSSLFRRPKGDKTAPAEQTPPKDDKPPMEF